MPNCVQVATVSHHGKNPNAGHYTADVKQPDGRWLRFDDATVTSVPLGQVRCLLAHAWDRHLVRTPRWRNCLFSDMAMFPTLRGSKLFHFVCSAGLPAAKLKLRLIHRCAGAERPGVPAVLQQAAVGFRADGWRLTGRRPSPSPDLLADGCAGVRA